VGQRNLRVIPPGKNFLGIFKKGYWKEAGYWAKRILGINLSLGVAKVDWIG